MKQKSKITEQDYVKAMLKANRELEIELHGKQVSMRVGAKHKSMKGYNRQKAKKVTFTD
jgi:hypothetical protein